MSHTLELLLARFKGKIIINISDIADVLGYRENHCRNLISQDKFPIKTFVMGSRRVARVDALANFIDELSAQPSTKKRRGPRTKKEKIAAAAAEGQAVRHA